MKVMLTVKRHQGRRRKRVEVYRDIDLASSPEGTFFAFYPGKSIHATRCIERGRVEQIAADGLSITGLVAAGGGKWHEQEWWCVPIPAVAEEQEQEVVRYG